MKKNIIALAIAGALAAPLAAQAEVTVYGKAHLSIDSVSESYDSVHWVDANNNGIMDIGEVTVNTNVSGDVNEVNSRASRVGVKGSEDLGNGLKAVYGMEWEVSLDENSGINKGRNAFVGMAGGFGTVLAGKHDTPMKMSTAKLDMFSDESGDYNTTVGFHDVRANNAIAYVSPAFSGLTIAAAIVPGETAGSADGFTDATSVAGMYSGGPLYAALAYEVITQDYLNAAYGNFFSDDFVKTRAGVGYAMAGLKVGLVYEKQDFGSSADRDLFQIQAGYTMGANTFKAMYGSAGDLGDAKDTGRDTYAVGVDHAFSKTTKVYAQYTAINHNDADLGTVDDIVGMIQDTAAGDVTYKVNQDSSVISLGMSTSF